MRRRRTLASWTTLLALAAVIGGCRAPGRPVISGGQETARRVAKHPPVRRVVCLYDQKPWLSLDKHGDRDPEGLHYRVYLDVGNGRGSLLDGQFHIEMYRVDRVSPEKLERTLASDWSYATSTFNQIDSKVLGKGYHVNLRWADKDIAGHEIEVVTLFEDVSGRAARAPTKRLRVPKHAP